LRRHESRRRTRKQGNKDGRRGRDGRIKHVSLVSRTKRPKQSTANKFLRPSSVDGQQDPRGPVSPRGTDMTEDQGVEGIFRSFNGPNASSDPRTRVQRFRLVGAQARRDRTKFGSGTFTSPTHLGNFPVFFLLSVGLARGGHLESASLVF